MGPRDVAGNAGSRSEARRRKRNIQKLEATVREAQYALKCETFYVVGRAGREVGVVGGGLGGPRWSGRACVCVYFSRLIVFSREGPIFHAASTSSMADGDDGAGCRTSVTEDTSQPPLVITLGQSAYLETPRQAGLTLP